MVGALGVPAVMLSGHPRDPARAREMFEPAAQKGSGAGLFYLGLLAYEGRDGVPKMSCLRKHLLDFEAGSA